MKKIGGKFIRFNPDEYLDKKFTEHSPLLQYCHVSKSVIVNKDENYRFETLLATIEHMLNDDNSEDLIYLYY